MTTRKFCFFFFLVPTVFAGCSQALPSTIEDKELSKHAQRAEVAAQLAQGVAEESAAIAENNLRLVAEMKEMAARTEQAEKNCASLLLRIPKPKPRVVVCKPEPEKPSETTPAEKPASAVIEYSPSDAPVPPAPKVEEK